MAWAWRRQARTRNDLTRKESAGSKKDDVPSRQGVQWSSAPTVRIEEQRGELTTNPDQTRADTRRAWRTRRRYYFS